MRGASGSSDEEFMGESRTEQVSFDYELEESLHTKRMSPPTQQFAVRFQWTSLMNGVSAAFDQVQ
jgi:hypothetical protein